MESFQILTILKVLPGEHPEAAHRGCPPADPGASFVAAVWPPPRRRHRCAAGGGTHILPARREFCFHIFGSIDCPILCVGTASTEKYSLTQGKRHVIMWSLSVVYIIQGRAAVTHEKTLLCQLSSCRQKGKTVRLPVLFPVLLCFLKHYRDHPPGCRVLLLMATIRCRLHRNPRHMCYFIVGC